MRLEYLKRYTSEELIILIDEGEYFIPTFINSTKEELILLENGVVSDSISLGRSLSLEEMIDFKNERKVEFKNNKEMLLKTKYMSMFIYNAFINNVKDYSILLSFAFCIGLDVKFNDSYTEFTIFDYSLDDSFTLTDKGFIELKTNLINNIKNTLDKSDEYNNSDIISIISNINLK